MSKTPNREEFVDRLIDVALSEIVGGAAPPDLSERILSKVGAQAEQSSKTTLRSDVMATQTKRTFWRWVSVAIAASLLIGGGFVLFGERPLRDAAHRPAAVPVAAKPNPGARSGKDDAAKAGEKLIELNDLAEQTEQVVEAEVVASAKPGPVEYFHQAVRPLPQAGAEYGTAGDNQASVVPLYTSNNSDFSTQPQAAGNMPQLQQQVAPLATRTFGGYARPAHGIHRFESRRPEGLGLQAGDAEFAFQGRGADLGGDKYSRIVENAFKAISASNTDNRLSTFSIDVDTASYANVRQFLMQSGALPPPDAVRIEELVNYFDYDYSPPTGDVPFAANVEVAACSWAPEHRLARIGIKGREIDRSKRPKSNLVFLIDISGSMDEPNKLPLLLEGMKLLTRELGENDRVAIVVYAGQEGLALPSTSGSDQSKILATLDQLTPDGSTAGAAGIQLAYKIAKDNFVTGGVNRVILCTDGDFNVGVTSPADLERMAEQQAKDTGVFLTVLGFGRGNLNDAMMEQIADKGNGNYHYVDTRNEARKVLVEEMSGTLVTIAKDVKIQLEFNPAKVAGYRLIGYENRVMAAEDFNDDKKDAGEIGAGHTVTALYELVPAGMKVPATPVDELKYAPAAERPESADESEANDGEPNGPAGNEMLTLKIRYKEPDGDKSTKLEFAISDDGQSFAKASEDFKFASAVASFGMLLRDSQYVGNTTFAAVAEIAESAAGRDRHGYRKQFVEMVRRAKELKGE